MKLTDLQGLHYIDFKPSDQPLTFQTTMIHGDICDRLTKAIHDENQAIADYKGFTAHYWDHVPSDIRDEIIEISNDETDHRAKFAVIFKALHC